MAAPFSVYVDLTVGSNTGTGTAGNPYGRLQYALDQRASGGDGGNGHSFECFGSGTLAAHLSLATYGAPSHTAPLRIRGITATPGDGGIGTLNGANTYGIFSAANYLSSHLRNMHFTQLGGTYGVRLGTGCSIVNCEISDSTVTHGLFVLYIGAIYYGFSLVKNCYLDDLAATNGIICSGFGVPIINCRIVDGVKKISGFAIRHDTYNGALVQDNIIAVSGAAGGVRAFNSDTIKGNSIYSAGGSGQGLSFSSTADFPISVDNNIIEGFTGGMGMVLPSTGSILSCDGNALYNNGTHVSGNDRILNGDTANIILTASAFRDAANGDFRLTTSGGALVNSQVQESAKPNMVGLY